MDSSGLLRKDPYNISDDEDEVCVEFISKSPSIWDFSLYHVLYR